MTEKTQTTEQNTAQKIHEKLGVSTQIMLLHPVNLVDGTRLEKLNVRAMTIGDVRASAVVPNDILREVFLFSRLTGLVAEDLDLLHFSDYQQLQGLFRSPAV